MRRRFISFFFCSFSFHLSLSFFFLFFLFCTKMRILRKNPEPDCSPYVELPTEIVDHILTLVPRQHLIPLRLCNRAWRDMICPKVFDRLALRLPDARRVKMMNPREETMQRFRSMWVDACLAAERASCERLSPFVRSVDVRIDCFTLVDVVALLTRCPRVNELTLGRGVCVSTEWQLTGGPTTGWQRPTFERVNQDRPVDLTEIWAQLLKARRLISLALHGPLPMSDFRDKITPHLGNLRELNLLSAFDTSLPSADDPICFDWRELNDLQAHCPNLNKLAFVQTPNVSEPSYIKAWSRHGIRIDTKRDPTAVPWSSITSLTIQPLQKSHMDHVPLTIAVLCIKFPNLEALEFHFMERQFRRDPHLPPVADTWLTYLDLSPSTVPNGYLPNLTSVTFNGLFGNEPIDVLHHYMTSTSPSTGQARAALEVLHVASFTFEHRAMDVVRTLDMFPSLHTLKLGRRRDEQASHSDFTSLPASRRPLRSLEFGSTNDNVSLNRLSYKCRDLAFLKVDLCSTFVHGRHPPPAPVLDVSLGHFPSNVRDSDRGDLISQSAMVPWLPDAVLALEPVQKLIGAQMRDNTRFVHWISLFYSTRLETLDLTAYRDAPCHLFFLIHTPVCDSNSTCATTTTATTETNCYAWFTFNGYHHKEINDYSQDLLFPLGLEVTNKILNQLDTDSGPKVYHAYQGAWLNDESLAMDPWVLQHGGWDKDTMVRNACRSAKEKGIAIILTPVLPKRLTILSEKTFY
ncbi:hypothetical protein BC940DRAFT_289410, partial [Gongronella butleri]